MLQIQDQSLRPLATAHLAQTMSLLALSNVDLQEKVLEELNANPALELLDERVCPNCQRKLPPAGPCPKCSAQSSAQEPVVFLSPRDMYRPPRGTRQSESEVPYDDLVAPEDLLTHVLQQLAADLDQQDRQLATFILCSLDEDGFLVDPPALIARLTRSPLSQVTRVVDLISRADPPGLATLGPRQALLVQLDLLDPLSPQVQLARSILGQAFAELGRREYDRIAALVQANADQVRKAAAFIQENLNPYPARAFWGSGRQSPAPEPNVYHVPDIQVTQASPDDSGPLTVEIFSPIGGSLRVNPDFRHALGETEGEAHEEWKRHVERASLFVKCLQQRNNTMRQLMRLLAAEQADFILHGDRHLKPMTRAKAAGKLGVHESTISRAVTQKSIALPDGRIVPLARFFDRSLPVRDRIREIVAKEKQPLTDDEIVELLKGEGLNIARRTVAKYRSLESILPARLRQRGQ